MVIGMPTSQTPPSSTPASPVLEGAALAFAEATANPPYPFDLSVSEGRKTVDQAQDGDFPDPAAARQDLTIAGGPTGEVQLSIYHPRRGRDCLRQLQPLPGSQVRTAIEQIYAVLQWIVSNGADHALDPSRIAVAGDSVGGNMTAAVTILAKRLRYLSSVQRYDPRLCHAQCLARHARRQGRYRPGRRVPPRHPVGQIADGAAKLA
jgi:alpha/beta hydrolase fold